MKSRLFALSLLCLAFIGLITLLSFPLSKVRAQVVRVVEISHAKQLYFAQTQFVEKADDEADATEPKNISALLETYGWFGLSESFLFISAEDEVYFDKKVPSATGTLSDSGEFNLDPEMLSFPIGFSFAVYPPGKGSGSRAPLFWTRGLQHYRNFDQEYQGVICFTAGYVESFLGKAGIPNPDLDAIFGPDSEFSEAVRILEHEPEGWPKKPLAPLPVRNAHITLHDRIKSAFIAAALCAPAGIAGIVGALLSSPTTRRRIWRTTLSFGVGLVGTFIAVLIVGLL